MISACASGGDDGDPFDTGDGAVGGDDATYDGTADGASGDGPSRQDSSSGARDAASTDSGQSPEGGGDDAPAGLDGTGGDGAPTSDGSSSEDGAASDAHDAGDALAVSDVAAQDGPASTNIAPNGTGYTWQSMTTSAVDTGKTAAPAVNDGSLSTQVNIDSSSGDKANAWEGAGVTFSSGRAVSGVSFVQGATATGGDGWFEANFKLQLSNDGTTWMDSGWSVTPAYSYSSAVSGKTYAFHGAQAAGIKGARVVGQVNTTGNSWWAAVKEVEVYGY
jgi:hypothetical protein